MDLFSVFVIDSLTLLRIVLEANCIQRYYQCVLKKCISKLYDQITSEQFYNQPNRMLKLNDFLNPQNGEKGIALIRSLKNSIKRNIMLPSLQMTKSQNAAEYQSKLTGQNFQHKDLYLLFQHMYSKQEMSVSDRNLIRRILLTMFPQALIFSAGRKFISFTKFINIEKGHKGIGNNVFYLVMKGSIKIYSPFYQKKITSGMYFGHLQIISCMPNDSFQFKAESQTSLICISEEGFRQTLLEYFNGLYEKKLQILPRALQQKLEPIQKLLLCEEMNKKTFNIGQKIIKKGQQIKQIIFIEKGKLSQNLQLQFQQKKLRTQNTIGLTQTILGQQKYLSNFIALQQIKAYCLPIRNFEKIVTNQFLLSLKEENKMSSKLIQVSISSQIKTENFDEIQQLDNSRQLDPETYKKFMRIRKVNLPYNKLKTCQSQTREGTELSRSFDSKYQASFIFLHEKVSTNRKKLNRINRSQLLFTQPKKENRYLDNIHVPSLEQFKSFAYN